MHSLSSLRSLIEVARHELFILLKTRRAFAVAGLYFASALVGSLLYVMMLSKVEQTMSALGGLIETQNFKGVLTFLVGADLKAVAAPFKESTITPVILWGSLTFLPFLILLTSFDQTVNAINSRSICYSLLRTSRRSFLLGKVLAQAALFMGLTALCGITLLVISWIYLNDFNPLIALPGFLRVWLSILPYGLFYLGVTAFSSACARQPSNALWIASGVLFLFQVFGWLENISPASGYGFLRHLAWLSPGKYVGGLWLADPLRPLLSSAAFLLLASGLLFLGIKRLEARDL